MCPRKRQIRLNPGVKSRSRLLYYPIAARVSWGTPVESVSPDVTALLKRLADGNQDAANQLVPMIYQELHRLAVLHLRHERPNHTLQPTALVHEAYLKLVAQRHADWQSRTHFFAVASNLMRRILVDYARRHLRAKRGDRQHCRSTTYFSSRRNVLTRWWHSTSL